MGRPGGWASELTGRPVMRSPGRPPAGRREHRVRFWAAIGRGLSSVDAAAEAGVSAIVGVRWFREGGGMPSVSLAPLSGRYLSFAEREEIALLRAQGGGVREVARQLGRSPSTISRELRRNAGTRTGRLTYRASTAQWHADRRARRPKPAKLAVNGELRRYVQDRLSGAVERPGGVAVEGPEVRWIGRRHGRRQDRRWAKAWSPEQISARLRLEFPDDDDDADLARSDIPVAVCAGPRCAQTRADGVFAHRQGAASPESAYAARQELRERGAHDQRASRRS